MSKFLRRKLFAVLGIISILFFVFLTYVYATATVTAATGGGAIPADTAGGSHTPLTGPVISEDTKGDIGTGTIILNVPSGFEFDTTTNSVTATVGAVGSCSNPNSTQVNDSSSETVTPTTSTITVTVTRASKGNDKCKITYSGIKVRPTATSPLASGNITKGSESGNSTINGVTNGSTSFGTLTEVAGAVSASSSTVSASPTSIPADGTTTSTIIVTLKDQFGNAISGKTVTLSSSRGATDTISAASGPSNSSGVVTFTVKSSTVGSATFTAVGDSVTITQTANVTFTDGTSPTAAGIPTTASPTTNNTPTWNWTAGSDNIGVDHYVLYWSTTAGGETYNSGNLTSATLSFSHSTPLADGTWYAKVRTFDAAGNYTDSGNGSVTIDTTAPTGSVSINGGVAYTNSRDVTINFSGISGDPTQFKIRTNNCGDTVGSYSTKTFINPYTPYTLKPSDVSIPDGSYSVSVKFIDALGNESNPVQSDCITLDRINPTDPTDVASTDHSTGIPSNDTTIAMAWTTAGTAPGATDATSGVAGYSYEFTQGATDVPDSIQDLPFDSTGVISSSLSEGTWYFHLRTVDNAGNWTSTVHAGPYVIDTTAPSVDITNPESSIM